MTDTNTIGPNTKFIAKTISGLEEVLASELVNLGAENVEILGRAVSFEGDKRMLYASNLWLRTALRVLAPVSSFQMSDEDDLYFSVKEIPWENYMTVLQTLSVDAVVTNSDLTHSHFVALKTKDAIVDRFRDIAGRRPNVDTENPDLKVNIHINGNTCDISLDSSGASLHKRGYRVSIAEAPLSEVLAAGLIYLSGWDKKSDFMDPMCGSGTLLIEAALIAQNIAPGIYREDFGFMHWLDFDKVLWEEVKNDAFDRQVEFEYQISGNDISKRNLGAAKANIHNARLHKDIDLMLSAFESLPREENESPRFIIINPPYGERMVTNDIIGLYKTIGNTLKQNYTGSEAWVISSDFRALSSIGLHASKKYTVWNGPLECKFVRFELYKGHKADQFQDSDNETGESDVKQFQKDDELRKPFERSSRPEWKKPGFEKKLFSRNDERGERRTSTDHNKDKFSKEGKFRPKEDRPFKRKETRTDPSPRFEPKKRLHDSGEEREKKPYNTGRSEKKNPARKTSDGKEWIPYEQRTFRKPTIPQQDQSALVKRGRKKLPGKEENEGD